MKLLILYKSVLEKLCLSSPLSHIHIYPFLPGGKKPWTGKPNSAGGKLKSSLAFGPKYSNDSFDENSLLTTACSIILVVFCIIWTHVRILWLYFTLLLLEMFSTTSSPFNLLSGPQGPRIPVSLRAITSCPSEASAGPDPAPHSPAMLSHGPK